MNFWDVIKEVSPRTVRQEADRMFVLCLAGDPEGVSMAKSAVLGAEISEADAAAAEPFLHCVSPPYTDDEVTRMRYSDLLISLPGGPERTEYRPADTITLAVGEDPLAAALDRKPDLRVSFSRRFPGFRRLAAEQVINDVSRVNAEFCAVSGISQAIPYLGPFFPAVIGADLLMLTKNQVLMTYRLAAIHGESLELRDRAREALAVIGSGFGLRVLARSAAALLPGPFALPLKVTVAFSGTYAVGRAAQIIFDKGREPTKQEMLRIYEEASRLAKETAARVLEQVGKLGKGTSRKPANGESAAALQAETAGPAADGAAVEDVRADAPDESDQSERSDPSDAMDQSDQSDPPDKSDKSD